MICSPASHLHAMSEEQMGGEQISLPHNTEPFNDRFQFNSPNEFPEEIMDRMWIEIDISVSKFGVKGFIVADNWDITHILIWHPDVQPEPANILVERLE